MSLSLSLVALLFPIASHHYVASGSEDHYREVNPGILAEIKVNEGTYEAGMYANSQYRTTFTVQRRFTGAQSYWFNIGARLGVCTGYRAATVIPCGGASLRVGQYVDLMFVPPVHNFTPAVTALTFRMPL